MNAKIPISLDDLTLMLFGSHTARSAYLDDALYHWTRRAGAPIMDMPSKIVLPHIAQEILAADPTGYLTHVQTVVASPDFTYYVLWLRDHWNNSEEKRRARFFEMQAVRQTIDAETAHRDRLGVMAGQLHKATGFPLRNAETTINSCWHKAQSEESFRDQIYHLEELLMLQPNTIYVKPNEDDSTRTENPSEERPEESPRPRARGEEKQGVEYTIGNEEGSTTPTDLREGERVVGISDEATLPASHELP
jgi:hypothetical protein